MWVCLTADTVIYLLSAAQAVNAPVCCAATCDGGTAGSHLGLQSAGWGQSVNEADSLLNAEAVTNIKTPSVNTTSGSTWQSHISSLLQIIHV